nr:Hsp20/alpha crystallin family protein [Maliibacterium massiliense]
MASLIPYRGRHGLARRNEGNSLFDDAFFRPFFDMSDFFETSAFRVDIKDKGDAYQLEAELPGVEQENINLSVDNNVLTIAADVNSERRDERENYVFAERRSGHCQRSFNIEGIDEEGISAQYRNGVLEVNLPKKAPQAAQSARKIDIK